MKPNRRNLGCGIDSSDSLLYEGVTGHVRRLGPLFASPKTNPNGCKLILLTKSTNVHYLEEVPRENTLATFSLNPEPIADLWEGKFNDGTRVTPSIAERLSASRRAQEMGFEVRWRIDPVIPCEHWQDIYATFVSAAARDGHKPTRITLGTYRETQRALRAFSRLWGLPAMEWTPSALEHDGAHYHLPKHQRREIYGQLLNMIRSAWPGTGTPIVAFCKEPRDLRRELGLDHDMCNCG
jgi:DNA repair photolyase